MRHIIGATADRQRLEANVPPEERARREFRIVRKTPQHNRPLPLARQAREDRPRIAVLTNFRTTWTIKIQPFALGPKQRMRFLAQPRGLRRERRRLGPAIEIT